MNNKIFNLLIENLKESFKLPKYATILRNLSKDTVVKDLPWTPARYNKFKEKIQNVLDLECVLNGTVQDIVTDLDIKYSNRFFGEIWKIGRAHV